MRMRPQRLNAAIASLFMVGSACFVLGSVPAFLDAVGGVVDGVTYFVGSIFFTSASFLQLLQAQSPSMTEVERHGGQTGTADVVAPAAARSEWLAAITQFPGTLFFNLSTAAALVRNATVQQQDRHVWRPDLFGSTLFLVASTFGILALGTLLESPAPIVSVADRLAQHGRVRSCSWPRPSPASSCRAPVM